MNKTNVKIIELDLSTFCNAKCPLCFRNFKNFPEKYKISYFRHIEEVKTQLNEFPFLEELWIIGQMSEPTLYPNLFELIEYLKNRKIKIRIFTNGDTHDNSFWRKLAEKLDDNDEVRFTLCGSTPELHEMYRRGTNLYRVFAHLNEFRNVRHIDTVNCIRFNYNAFNIDSEGFRDICKKFKEYYIFNTNTDNPEKYNKIKNFNDYLPVKKIDEEFKKTEKYADIIFKIKNKNICCTSLKDFFIYIDVYGDIFPCYEFFESNPYFKWNLEYSDIISKKYNCCKFCQKQIFEKLDKLDLDG